MISRAANFLTTNLFTTINSRLNRDCKREHKKEWNRNMKDFMAAPFSLKPSLLAKAFKKRSILVKCLVSIAFLVAYASTSNISYATSNFGDQMQLGYVMSRGIVLGPNKKPIYVTYNEKGEVARTLGEETGELLDSFLIPGSAYKFYADKINQFLVNNETVSIMIISRSEFERSISDIYESNQVFNNGLQYNTRSIVVRTDESRVPGVDPVIMEAPINMLHIDKTISEDDKVLLVDRYGDVKHKTEKDEVNIGYKVAYLQNKDGTDTTDEVVDYTLRSMLETYDITSPIEGALVFRPKIDDMDAGISDEKGLYVVRYHHSVCPGISYSIESYIRAELMYSDFDPMNPRGYGKLYIDAPVVNNCVGYGQGAPDPSSLTSVMSHINLMAEEATSSDFYPLTNIKVDLFMFTGRARFTNETGYVDTMSEDQLDKITIADKTSYKVGEAYDREVEFFKIEDDYNGNGDIETRLVTIPDDLWIKYISDVKNTDDADSGLHDIALVTVDEDEELKFVDVFIRGKDPLNAEADVRRRFDVQLNSDTSLTFSQQHLEDSDLFIYLPSVGDFDETAEDKAEREKNHPFSLLTLHKGMYEQFYNSDTGEYTFTMDLPESMRRYQYNNFVEYYKDCGIVQEEGMTPKVVITHRGNNQPYALTLEGSLERIDEEISDPGGNNSEGTVPACKQAKITVNLKDIELKGAPYKAVDRTGNKAIDQGLLSTIAEEDLKETDIYIYRMSNNQLIGKKSGLYNEFGLNSGGIGDKASDDEEEKEGVINYHIHVRGPSVRWDYGSKRSPFLENQEKIEADEALQKQEADILRMGEQIKLIAINRKTGYMGSMITTVGSQGGLTGEYENNLPIISFDIGTLKMMPPNLKIWAERSSESQSGLFSLNNYGEMIQVIGFEGAALTADKYITIKSEWLDHDGSPLPPDIVGFTGRLAIVDDSKKLSTANSSSDNLFGINPGLTMQMVQLQEDSLFNSNDVDLKHYYVHVSPQKYLESMDDPLIETAGDSVGQDNHQLIFRPKRYVPFRVPVFNSNSTRLSAEEKAKDLNNDYSQGDEIPVLDDIERIYSWPYKPEYQFTIYDLSPRQINTVSSSGNTSVVFAYELTSPDEDDLDPFGELSDELLISLGYTEKAAKVDLLDSQELDKYNQFNDVNSLNELLPASQAGEVDGIFDLLQPEDFLALQLYQDTDRGNMLYEVHGLPLLIVDTSPIRLKKTSHKDNFKSEDKSDNEATETDGYQSISFSLTQPAEITVTFDGVNKDNEIIRTIIEEDEEIPPGDYTFIIDYKMVEKIYKYFPPIGKNKPDFKIRIEAKAEDGLVGTHKAFISGHLDEEDDESLILGQIVEGDVLIQRGSLNISKPEFSLKGRGPQFGFSRSYSNESNYPGVMGQGWNHSLDIKLSPMCPGSLVDGDACLPNWVSSYLEEFFTDPIAGRIRLLRPSEIPEEDEPLSKVSVMGAQFKKVNGEWITQRGRYEELTEEGSGDDKVFKYTSKQGDVYTFPYPKRIKPEGVVARTMSIGDDIVTRVGVDPSLLNLDDAPSKSGQAGNPAQPSGVTSIEDRNSNKLTFTYEEKINEYGQQINLLQKVEDSAGRAIQLNYLEPSAGQFRLSTVEAPEGKQITYKYDKNGQLEEASRTGGNGQIEKYTYQREPNNSGFYNIKTITDALDRSYTYEYYLPGDIDTQMQELVSSLRSEEVVKKVTFPDDNTFEFTYDYTNGESIREVTNLRGIKKKYTLNEYGNPKESITYANLGEDKTTYDWPTDKNADLLLNGVKTSTKETTYAYDELGNVKTITEKDLTAGGETHKTEMTWNDFSQQTYKKNKDGNEETWTYDDNGNLTQHVNTNGETTTYTYESNGDVATKTNNRGALYKYTYDDNGVTEKVDEPEGTGFSYEIDDLGRVTKITDKTGAEISYVFDAFDRAITITESEGSITTNEYNSTGMLYKVTKANGLVLTYSYDARDRVTKITDNIGGTKEIGYDAEGNITLSTNWYGNGLPRYETETRYDDFGRVTREINPDKKEIVYTYSNNGTEININNFNGYDTKYYYDGFGRKTKVLFPDQKTNDFTYSPEGKMLTSIDRAGGKTTYEYDGMGRKTARINNNGDRYIWSYDGVGNLTSETDEENRVVKTNTYDLKDRLTKAEDGEGKAITYTYNTDDTIKTITDGNGKVTKFEYDDLKRRTKITGPDPGVEYTYTYDLALNQKTETDGDDNSRQWTYDRKDRLTHHKDGNGYLTKYEHYADGKVKKITDPRGTVTKYTYNNLGMVTTMIKGEAPYLKSYSYTYDDMGNMKSVTNEVSEVTVFYTYNNMNLRTDIDEAGLRFTKIDYDDVGNILSVKLSSDGKVYTTNYEYDELNRLEATYVNNGPKEKYGYDKAGLLTQKIDKKSTNPVTTYGYYDNYQIKEITKGSEILESYQYDAVGNVTSYTGAEGNTVVYKTYNGRNLPESYSINNGNDIVKTYDSAGRVLTVTDESGITTTYTYDAEGRTTSTYNEDEMVSYDFQELGAALDVEKGGFVTHYTFDIFGRPKTVSRDGEELIAYDYDSNDNLLQQVSYGDVEVVLTKTYDDLNRIKTETQGGSRTTQYVYEGLYLDKVVDANGRARSYEYDDLARVSKITYESISYNSTPKYGLQYTSYGYDDNDNVTSVTEQKLIGSDQYIMEYDALNRLIVSNQRGNRVSYTYPTNEPLKSIVSPKGTTSFTYDSNNRVLTAGTSGQYATYGYYPNGRLKTATNSNGTKASYTYNKAGNILTLSNTKGGDTLSDFTYTYDARGNRETIDGQIAGQIYKANYTYNSHSQLETQETTHGAWYESATYTYDNAFNRKTEKVTRIQPKLDTDGDIIYKQKLDPNGDPEVDVNGDPVYVQMLDINGDPLFNLEGDPVYEAVMETKEVKNREFTYDNSNRLLKISDNVDPQNPFYINFQYDENGNLLKREDTREQPEESLHYAYNPRDELVRVTRGPPSTGEILGEYDYDYRGYRVRHSDSSQGDLEYVYNGDRLLEKRNTINGSYTRYTDGVTAIGFDTGTEKEYYHQDALGTSVSTTNALGVLKSINRVGVWGSLVQHEGTSTNRQIYNNQEHDQKTGLIYYGARYYDPEQARFITQDPFRGHDLSPVSKNRYLYGVGNPSTYRDENGNVVPAVVWGVVAIAGIFTAGAIIDMGMQAYEAGVFSGRRSFSQFINYDVSFGRAAVAGGLAVVSWGVGSIMAQAGLSATAIFLADTAIGIGSSVAMEYANSAITGADFSVGRSIGYSLMFAGAAHVGFKGIGATFAAAKGSLKYVTSALSKSKSKQATKMVIGSGKSERWALARAITEKAKAVYQTKIAPAAQKFRAKMVDYGRRVHQSIGERWANRNVEKVAYASKLGVQLDRMLRYWVKGLGLTKSARQNRMVSVFYNIKTREFFFGRSGGTQLSFWKDVNWRLKPYVAIQETKNFFLRTMHRFKLLKWDQTNSAKYQEITRSVTNCAEFRAKNAAYNSGSKASDLVYHTALMAKTYSVPNAPPIPACSNCQFTTIRNVTRYVNDL